MPENDDLSAIEREQNRSAERKEEVARKVREQQQRVGVDPDAHQPSVEETIAGARELQRKRAEERRRDPWADIPAAIEVSSAAHRRQLRRERRARLRTRIAKLFGPFRRRRSDQPKEEETRTAGLRIDVPFETPPPSRGYTVADEPFADDSLFANQDDEVPDPPRWGWEEEEDGPDLSDRRPSRGG
jgi:hypothetical protein